MIPQLIRALGQDAAELLSIPIRNQFPPRIDLSVQNAYETGNKIYERDLLFAYIDHRRQLLKTDILWGGYLEQRLIYASSSIFHQEQAARDIHLGLDFWVNEGTLVFAPLAGKVHSFHDNKGFRDYGPTIILEHIHDGQTFHSLYGHLSRSALYGIEVGQIIEKGQQIGTVGAEHENGEWPAHLHFQLIVDMMGYQGDFPGVCAIQQIDEMAKNCPDPRFLLAI
jgi:peptidoglycan LD-endopeptidase LytH